MTDDSISRQMAIDMFQRLSYDDWNQGVSTTWANAFAECAEIISELPSAELPDICVGDIISRQAAIDAIRNIRATTGTHDDEILLIDKAEAQTELMLLPTAEPQWIPCGERLPYAEYGESPNVYCYCCDLEQGGKWAQLLYFNGGVWCLPTGETFDYKVLAWYPLPTKPYR